MTDGYREFPKMMYHVVKPARIVTGREEMEQALAEGWAESQVRFSEAAVLDAKIAETEAMLKELKKKRKELHTL
jgi:hypothetical protein